MKRASLLILMSVFVFALGFGSAVTTHAGPPCTIGSYYWVISAGCCPDDWYIHVKYCNGIRPDGSPCGDCEWRCVYNRICAPDKPNDP